MSVPVEDTLELVSLRAWEFGINSDSRPLTISGPLVTSTGVGPRSERTVVTKLLASCLAAAAIAGAAAATATAVQTVMTSTSPAVQQVVFGLPLPLDPAADVPTAEQVTGVLSSLADPGVPFAAKSYLVEGGIGRIEARTADALMKNAVARGQIPLNFSVGPITPTGPGLASATVTATGQTMPPTTQTISFVDQGGWKLSRASATSVLAIFSA